MDTLLRDPERRFRVRSSSTTRLYTIHFVPPRQWSCDCPAWTYQRRRGDCKHIRQVQQTVADLPRE
jgi:hypothetical protein